MWGKKRWLRQAKEAAGGPKWGACGAALLPGPADPSSCPALFLMRSLGSSSRPDSAVSQCSQLVLGVRVQDKPLPFPPLAYLWTGWEVALYVQFPICDFSMNLISYFGAQEGEYCLRTFQGSFEANVKKVNFVLSFILLWGLFFFLSWYYSNDPAFLPFKILLIDPLLCTWSCALCWAYKDNILDAFNW